MMPLMMPHDATHDDQANARLMQGPICGRSCSLVRLPSPQPCLCSWWTLDNAPRPMMEKTATDLRSTEYAGRVDYAPDGSEDGSKNPDGIRRVHLDYFPNKSMVTQASG